MNLLESLRISWRSITGHKLRSTLTTIGVVIGIASVIVFLILGGAFTEDVLGDIETENQPVMQVSTQTTPPGGTGIRIVDTPIYTESDVEAVEALDGVEYAAPIGTVDAVQLAANNDSVTGGFEVQATDPQRFEYGAPLNLSAGEPFSASDEAVVSREAAQLFERNVTVGDRITITGDDGERTTFTVTGTAENELGAQFGQPVIYVPIEPHYNTTIETPRGTTERAYPELAVRATSIERTEAVKASVNEYFDDESDAAAVKRSDDRIVVQTAQDAIEQFTTIVDQLTVFVAGIAAISLVVGSVGIANIMIVSVTERTREIGIMKAIGARRRDIVQLFLAESIVLGGIGALLGVATGVSVGYLAVEYVVDWPMVYPWKWILLAVGVGVGVGIVAGIYPAWRAARVDPIEALRRE